MTKFNARLLTLTTIFCCSLSLGACVAEQGETNLETIESASRSDQRGDRPDEIDADRPTCADQCKARARTAVGQCVDSGRDRETCIRYGRNLVANCVENHCEQDAPTCEDRCDNLGQEALERCIDGGHNRARCARFARNTAQRCAAQHCQPEIECEEACIDTARSLANRCIEAGNDAEGCHARARQGAAQCIEDRCAADEGRVPPRGEDDNERPQRDGE